MWLREISSCSYLNVLPGTAWALLSKKYKSFPGSLPRMFVSLRLRFGAAPIFSVRNVIANFNSHLLAAVATVYE